MTILKRIAQVVLILAVLAAVAYPFRRDPLGPIAGKQLSGVEVSGWPADWSFSDEHNLIAIEVRPDDPHSVTVVCFVYENFLYVPSQGAAEKDWTQMVLADPRVRLKIGDAIFNARATRVTDESDRPGMFAAAVKKYPRISEAETELPANLWVFRIDPPTS
ncbi:MAG: nitroreductase family deazaflavin-dependent oxidoreductase [bacterium]|nr:nitroreductase family deazaflavin-dependent oxidoreductase [bacterium]